MLVGVARFELTTPASRRQCSTRLSYTPTGGEILRSIGRIKWATQIIARIDVIA